jgi:hypothetical protein
MKKFWTTIALLLITATAYAGTAHFTHETQGMGMTKQCHYKYLGEVYSITISKVKLCPLTIRV